MLQKVSKNLLICCVLTFNRRIQPTTFEVRERPRARFFLEISIKLPRNIRDTTFRWKGETTRSECGLSEHFLFHPRSFSSIRFCESTCIFSCHRIRSAIFFPPQSNKSFPRGLLSFSSLFFLWRFMFSSINSVYWLGNSILNKNTMTGCAKNLRNDIPHFLRHRKPEWWEGKVRNFRILWWRIIGDVITSFGIARRQRVYELREERKRSQNELVFKMFVLLGCNLKGGGSLDTWARKINFIERKRLMGKFERSVC